MSYLDVYIGFSEGYSWTPDPDKFQIGNAPKRQSPFFPDGSTAFRRLVEKINSKVFHGEQVDWGAYAAIVTKEQILSFMEELYPPEWQEKTIEFNKCVGLPDEYGELKDFVETLSNDEKYILVASEL